MSKFSRFIFFFLLSCSSYAQNEIIISGSVLDINTQTPIEFATVFFSNVKDSTVIEYTSTDKNGFFKIATKKYEGSVFLKIDQTGYQTFIEEHSGLKENKDFGKIYLLNNKYALDEIVIVKDIPIKIKKDTLEFNAASFKVRPDSNVETLLKELPGFEVDSGGKITVNGKEVNQVLVNGKAFFDKEGLMILKNLPAEIINKIQVSDFKTKKEELSKQDSTSDFSSINITIDEKKNKGVFGKFLGGYGSDERYESSFILNFFKDKQKISVLASSNNINATGFSMDDVFDNMGGGRNSKRETTAPPGKGITQSNLAGISYSDQWNKKIEAVGSYDYKNTTNENQSKSKQVNFLPDSTNFTDAESKTKNENTVNKANFELEYKINPTIRLVFEPTINQTHSNNNLISASKAKNDKEEPINESATKSNRESDNITLGNTINFNKTFAKKSRNLSFVFNNNYTSNDSDGVTVSQTLYFKKLNENKFRNQNILNKNTFTANSADIEYTEPITDSLRVRIGVDLDLNNEETNLKTYDFNAISQSYIDLNALQSNYTNSSRYSIRPKAGLTYEKNKYTFNINSSTAIIDYDNHSLFLNEDTNLNQKYILPYANAQIRYRITRSKYLSFKYDYDNTLPTPTQLIPVPNFSNPLVTIIGNPNIKPNETHTASISYKNYNYRTRSGYSFYLKTNLFVEEIVTKQSIDGSGQKETRYTNVEDTHSTSIGGNWNQTIKNNAHVFRYSISFNGNYSFDKGFTNGVMFSAKSTRLTPGGYLSYDYGELLTIAPSYKLTYNETKYENSAIDANSNVLHNINLQTTSYWPKNWVFGNDFGYTYNSNISGDFKKDFYLWNTSLSYGFFDKKMIVKVKVYDILNQNQSATRTINPTSIRDEENTVLKRYAMFSLSYKLGNFGGKEKRSKGQRNREMGNMD
jgi:hypothetical protein